MCVMIGRCWKTRRNTKLWKRMGLERDCCLWCIRVRIIRLIRHVYFNERRMIISLCCSLFIHCRRFISVNEPRTPNIERRVTPQRIPAYNYALRGILFRGHRRIFLLHFLSLGCERTYMFVRHIRTRLHVTGLHSACLRSIRTNGVRKISYHFYILSLMADRGTVA